PTVAARSMMVAINSPWVVRLSLRASTRPRRNSFSTRAPAIRTASPRTLRTTISLPRREPGSHRNRVGFLRRGLPPRSGFAVTVSDAIEGFDRVEFRVHIAELLAHTLDVAVDRPIVDIDLIVVGGVHQVVAAFHESRPLRQGLQKQELGDRQLHRLAFPQAIVTCGIKSELAALDGPRGLRARRGRRLLALHAGAA